VPELIRKLRRARELEAVASGGDDGLVQVVVGLPVTPQRVREQSYVG
jgi:hypothetical protein